MMRMGRAGAALSRRRALGTLALGGGGFLLTACGARESARGILPGDGAAGEPADFSARFAGFEPADEPDGDLARVVWPAWMAQVDPEIKRLYEFQIRNGSLMRYIPCFCGCGSAAHRSNRDCYIKAVERDGSIVFDTMAPT